MFNLPCITRHKSFLSCVTPGYCYVQNGNAVVIFGQCQAVDIVAVNTDAHSPGGTPLGPTDSRMQQTPFMKGTLWGGN